MLSRAHAWLRPFYVLSPHIAQNGVAALINAISNKSDAVATALLERKANPNVQDQVPQDGPRLTPIGPGAEWVDMQVQLCACRHVHSVARSWDTHEDGDKGGGQDGEGVDGDEVEAEPQCCSLYVSKIHSYPSRLFLKPSSLLPEKHEDI